MMAKTWQDIIMREHLMVLKPTPYHTFSSPNLGIPHTRLNKGWGLEMVANYIPFVIIYNTIHGKDLARHYHERTSHGAQTNTI
jgi:hypothetical protein